MVLCDLLSFRFDPALAQSPPSSPLSFLFPALTLLTFLSSLQCAPSSIENHNTIEEKCPYFDGWSCLSPDFKFLEVEPWFRWQRVQSRPCGLAHCFAFTILLFRTTDRLTLLWLNLNSIRMYIIFDTHSTARMNYNNKRESKLNEMEEGKKYEMKSL